MRISAHQSSGSSPGTSTVGTDRVTGALQSAYRCAGQLRCGMIHCMSGETGNLWGHCRVCGTALILRERDMGITSEPPVYERYCFWCQLVQ